MTHPAFQRRPFAYAQVCCFPHDRLPLQHVVPSDGVRNAAMRGGKAGQGGHATHDAQRQRRRSARDPCRCYVLLACCLFAAAHMPAVAGQNATSDGAAF